MTIQGEVFPRDGKSDGYPFYYPQKCDDITTLNANEDSPVGSVETHEDIADAACFVVDNKIVVEITIRSSISSTPWYLLIPKEPNFEDEQTALVYDPELELDCINQVNQS